MTIEQARRGVDSFSHLDALTSSVPLNVDQDAALSFLPGATFASLRQRLTGYHHATSDTI
jgi:hypothetical protein